MKKIMLLGGSRYALPLIEAAHNLGCKVYTCDYWPGNVAHRHSDSYENISIVDKESVLRRAEELRIDGILSFACDPGVVTAAYVAERMGLPFQCSYDAACILQDKGKFRRMLAENGFNCPNAGSYRSLEEAWNDLDAVSYPIIVKPVDSAGSKGVTKAESRRDAENAINEAIKNSISGGFILEEFLTFKGFHSSADAFSVDGRIEFITYSDQLFDHGAANPYTPSQIIWPSTMARRYQELLTAETQRLFDLLGMRTGIYNIETCVDECGAPYLMEVSPRGGGCKIAEIQEMAYGANLIENEVRKAVGLPLVKVGGRELKSHWCEMVIHSHGESGIFRGLEINPEIWQRNVRNIDLGVGPGDDVLPFTGANASLGDIFLEFGSRKELDDAMMRNKDWLKILLHS